ncbi:hypothetical protein [Spirosoma agri]|uniref:DUF2306 domain-containing protein n=1 Tax=Spirosoma agri TaxID=1987381 RepID=A0A6M0INP9_9BACT|nr:hypothetical protein [Spirosoma agri]NEU69946.1 hypothetical protein [Spirosoma agri]
MQTLHTVNIVVHIIFGILGLLIGSIALFYQNRAPQHVRYGRWFLYVLTVVVATAFVGILFFRSNSFLVILTLLSGYVGYSGYRISRLRERRASWLDASLAVVVLITGGLYLRSMQLSGGHWSPTVIYPTLLALVLVAGYDLIKYIWLFQRLKKEWLYEHIYKMVSAYSALASAFGGTVLSSYQPHSQILPSAIGFGLIVYFIWKRARTKSNPANPVI